MPEIQTAAEIGKALAAAVAEESRLRAKHAALVDRRNDALVSGTDDDVDEVEIVLEATTRALDRLELRIPLLRTGHSAQLATEQNAIRSRDFEAAVSARLSAAAQVDVALDRLGAALRLLDGSRQRLQRAGVALGSTAERDLLGAVRLFAPLAERLLGLPHALSLGARPLAEAERERWDRVRDAGGTEAAAPARARAERAPPVEPVTAEELERMGRYGVAASVPVLLGAGWSDTDGELRNVAA